MQRCVMRFLYKLLKKTPETSELKNIRLAPKLTKKYEKV